MLVLTRKVGECLMIGDEIIVKVMEQKRNGEIRIGILAPKHVQIWRAELYKKATNSQ